MSDMSEGTQYPDVEPDGLGELKSIKRINGMLGAQAKRIAWGEEYRNAPIEERLKKAEQLAATMNNAADVLQTERNGMIEIAKQQEARIKTLQVSYDQQSELMEQTINKHNADRQIMIEDILNLTQDLKRAKRRIKELEAVGNDD